VSTADPVFAAVADGRRRAILEVLRGGERTAGQIAARFDVSWPAISRHLRVLKEAGLVNERREGRERLYTLDRGRLRNILGGWVAEFDRLWEDNLEALKREVESQQAGRQPGRKSS
jgi:DNA-binding transcriptional ArsR family regulator